MAWKDPLLDDQFAAARATEPSGLGLGAFDNAATTSAGRRAAIGDESLQRTSALQMPGARQPGFPEAELAYNDQTGEWAVQASDGSVRVVDKAPATLFALSDMPLPKIRSIPSGFRPVSQAELRDILASIPEDSDFWGEMGASFKTSIGLAASALDALVGRDDPSNALSNAQRDYEHGQTIGQYKAGQAAWYESLPGFLSGLGQTAGNIGGNVAMALPIAAAGASATGNPIGGVFAGAAGVSGAAGAAGEQATDFYTAAMETMAGMDEQQLLAESPAYRQARAQGLDHAQAMEQTAITGARAAMAPAAALGGLEGVVGGVLGRNILSKLGFGRAAFGGRGGIGRTSTRAVGGALAAGAEEVAETGFGQAAGAAATGVGSTDPRDYMSMREFEQASQGGFILGALGGRGRGDSVSGAMDDLKDALGQNAGVQSPNDGGPQRPAGPSGRFLPGPRSLPGYIEGEFTEVPPVRALPPPTPQGPPLQIEAPAPSVVAGYERQARAEQALGEFVRITGLQSPEEIQQAMPELLQLADENPGFKAIMDDAGLTPTMLPPGTAAQPLSIDQQQELPLGLPADQLELTPPPGRRPRASRMPAQVAAPEPIAAPAERTADGRPVGVAPAPLVNPEPMHPEQARQAAQTRAGRRAAAGVAPSPVDPQTAASAAPATPDSVTPSTPEPAGDIAAQVDALLDPESGRTAVFVAEGNEAAIPQDLAPDLLVAQRRGRGTLITTDPALAKKFQRGRWTDADTQRALGYSENKTQANVADGTVVEARTPEGAVAAQQLATNTPKNKRAAAAAVKRQARKDAIVVETTPERAQAERTARAAERPAKSPESTVQQRKLGPKAQAVIERRKAEKDVKKKSPIAAALVAKGLDVATDAEANPTRSPRAEERDDTTSTERAAARVQVTGESKPAPRLDVSRAAKRKAEKVAVGDKHLDLPETLLYETGEAGDVVDLRIQSVDENLRATLQATRLSRMAARDAETVERVLRDMDQLDTMLDAAVDAAEERLLDRLDKSAEGNAALDAAKAVQLRAEIAKRRRQREAAGKDNRGRPPGRTKASPLEFVPLLAEEMLHFGRLVRAQAKSELKGALEPARSVARRLIAQILPQLSDRLNNAETFADVVRMFAGLDDTSLDQLVRSAAPSLKDSLLAKQVMRGASEVARAHATQDAEIRKEIQRKSPGAQAQAEQDPDAREPLHVDAPTEEELGLEAEQHSHVRGFKGDLPEAALKTVNGWAAMLERGGTKTGEIHVMSMDVARTLYPNEFPSSKLGRYAQVSRDGKTTHVIAVDWDAYGDNYALEVLAHEFGEYAGREIFNRSSQETQEAVMDSYISWLAAHRNLSPTELFRTHAPSLLRTLASAKLDVEYASSFTEWLSNHVARYMITKPEPRSVVEKFFAKVAGFIRSVWDSMLGDVAPDSAVADMVDVWVSGRAANNAAGRHRIISTAGDMEWLGEEGAQPRVEMPGKRTAEAVVNRATSAIGAGKEAFSDVLQAALARDAGTLNAMGDSLYDKMMGTKLGQWMRQGGLAISTLDQIERRFRSSPLGKSLSAWVSLQKNKAQLAHVALYGGTFTMTGGEKVTFKGAAGVVERANHLATKVQDLLQDTMYYATHYGVHPDQTWEQNKHLHEGLDEAVVRSNRRRYEHVQNLWTQLGAVDPEAQAVFKDLRDRFTELHEQTLLRQIQNIEESEFSDRAKKDAIEKIRAYHKTLKNGPYFPLMRFGDWIVSVMQPAEATFHKTAADAEQERRNQKAINPGARIVVEKADGEFIVRTYRRGVYFFNSANEARAATAQIEADLREQYENAGVDLDEVKRALEEGRLDDEGRAKETLISGPKQKQDLYAGLGDVSPFISELRAEVKAKGLRIDPELAQIMENLYIEALPELSARKSMLPRQNVLGASRKMLRSYAMRFQGASHAYSGVAFGRDINKAWSDMQAVHQTGEFEPSGAVLQNLKASQETIANRMRDTIGNKVSNMLTDASSLFSLGFSPAYVLTNSMQPLMITLPTLAGMVDKGGKLVGATKAMTYLKDAYEGAVPFFSKRAMADFLDESRRLFGQRSGDSLHDMTDLMILKFGKTDDERAMLTRMLETGRLDFSFLNSIEDAMRGGAVASKFGNVARLAMAFPQQVEAMNRVVTALAAYRMGKAELGMDAAEATNHAYDVVGDTQLDYSRMNRPLLFNKPGLAVILQFKLYVQGMYALFIRNAYLATKGMTAEERRQGRATLMYLMGTHGAIGGATGLGPLAFVAKFGVGLAAMLMGRDDDDDEWKSSEQLLTEKARFLFGDKGADVATRGLPTLLGLDVADRIGFPNLLDTKYTGITERSGADEQMDKWTLYMLGAPYSNARRVVKAVGAAGDDDPTTRFTDGLPSGPRAMIKALTYARDGIVERDGDTFIPADALGWRDVAITAAGFQSAAVSRAYRTRSEEKGTMARIQTARTLLLKRWRTGDVDERKTLREEIRTFNESAPKPFRITSETLHKSVAAKKERETGAVTRNQQAVREYLE